MGGRDGLGGGGPLERKAHQCMRKVWGQGPAWCRTQGWPGAQSSSRAQASYPAAPWLGHPKSPPPLLRQAWCAGTFGQGCSGGRECLPVPGAEPSAARGLGAHGPARARGRRAGGAGKGASSTRRLCLGSCPEQALVGAGGGVWPREETEMPVQAGRRAWGAAPRPPTWGLAHLGCPVPTPWLRRCGSSQASLQKPALS